jgi:hypothetical protein
MPAGIAIHSRYGEWAENIIVWAGGPPFRFWCPVPGHGLQSVSGHALQSMGQRQVGIQCSTIVEHWILGSISRIKVVQ